MSILQSVVDEFLVVDGSHVFAHGTARTLSRFGTVTLAFTARDAEALLTRQWCAVIMDVVLHDSSGFELARRHRDLWPTAPLLLLTQETTPDLIAEAYKLEATCLRKPPSTLDLTLFACRAQSRHSTVASRILAVATEWSSCYELSKSEFDVLRLVALGHERAMLPELRQVEPSTIKKQVGAILRKTGDATLDAAIARLLRVTLNRY